MDVEHSGKQCVCIGAVAIALGAQVKTPDLWTVNDIDHLVKLGDGVSSLLRKEYPNLPDFLEPHDIKIPVAAGTCLYSIEAQKDCYGLMISKELFPGAISDTLESAVQKCSSFHGMFMSFMSYSMCIIPFGTRYCIFDSHSRDDKGMPVPTEAGSAIRIICYSVEEVAKYFRRLAIVFKKKETPFRLTGVNTTLYARLDAFCCQDATANNEASLPAPGEGQEMHMTVPMPDVSNQEPTPSFQDGQNGKQTVFSAAHLDNEYTAPTSPPPLPRHTSAELTSQTMVMGDSENDEQTRSHHDKPNPEVKV